MRRKILLLFAVIIMLAVTIYVNDYEKEKTERFEQHLQAARPDQAETGVYGLPLVKIDTNGQEVPGMQRDSVTILADVEILDDGNGRNRITDLPVVTTKARIRYRGNSSLHFDKKSYLLKFVYGDGTPNEQEVLGMPKEEEWILNGPFLDKSLLRNYMLMNISAQIMGDAPEVRFCELFVNEEYRGVYVMIESVSRSRVALQKQVAGKAETNYIVRLDRGGDVNDVELDNLSRYAILTGSVMNVVYPPKKNITPEQVDFMERDISQFEKSLYSLDYQSPRLGYRQYIDVGSFVDYMIINEFFQNYDAGRYSTYLHKSIGGLLTIGPVWDFNNAMDNYMEEAFDGTDFGFQSDVWYFMLLKDDAFVERVIRRYQELRQSVLKEEYLLQYVDDIVDYLGDAAYRNFSVWGYTFVPENGLLQPIDRNITSYEEAIDQVKNFIIKRGRWLDENIESLRQFSHYSKVKKYDH